MFLHSQESCFSRTQRVPWCNGYLSEIVARQRSRSNSNGINTNKTLNREHVESTVFDVVRDDGLGDRSNSPGETLYADLLVWVHIPLFGNILKLVHTFLHLFMWGATMTWEAGETCWDWLYMKISEYINLLIGSHSECDIKSIDIHKNLPKRFLLLVQIKGL